jgi:hypothetical protein
MCEASGASVFGRLPSMCSACSVELICGVQRAEWHGGWSRLTQNLQYFSRTAVGWGGRQVLMRTLGALLAVTAIWSGDATISSAFASSSSVALAGLVASMAAPDSSRGVHVAEVTCSSRDGSRTCSCDSKCHRTDDDCECEDD